MYFVCIQFKKSYEIRSELFCVSLKFSFCVTKHYIPSAAFRQKNRYLYYFSLEYYNSLKSFFILCRPLVVAMLCYTFHSLSKKFTSYNLKEMKRMLRRIDYEEMLRAEEQNPEAVQAVREKLIEISSFLSTDFVHINTDIPGDSFKM